ncbi:N-acetyl-gamma-glutamyl-phosphate reductase [Colwellia sp. BRX8-7]|jgi:N-acetyl-gamma-glutamyl-phosphate reductase|uniref:N-acetyl-gamma-glutamyl-phosphate reductase n=1 Tax=Colwellia sp. BRX8-7 TaxID=2759833 RepID=UPI0015F537C9|nr:N-acetyl-gamma-glutamyl-phosphate reductase [Colwellia sp. BRX8-7]MBA6338785.1 N-acetyl-gamma-glutamyl-phosphate reductase [Colwellia sp. BRX8-7]
MKVAVIGASGYVGAELINLLSAHDKISLEYLLVSENSSSADMTFSQLHPRYLGVCDLPLVCFSQRWFDDTVQKLDAVFFATPHEFSADWAQAFVEKGVKVFDLSGGFRLKNSEDYPTFYGFEHKNLLALAQATYGLAEWQQDDIANTQLVAVPGCYPTASLLSLKPITVNNYHLENSLIVVNGISGVSGAGRKASLATSFYEVSLTPYNILQHRHQPEISQEANAAVIFNPHLAPYKRGLLATVTLQIKAGITTKHINEAFLNAYQDKPLVRLTGAWPKIDNVANTPFADLHWQVDEEKQVVVVSCAIDNLLKGAASQAVQCANISLGLASEYSLLHNVTLGKS